MLKGSMCLRVCKITGIAVNTQVPDCVGTAIHNFRNLKLNVMIISRIILCDGLGSFGAILESSLPSNYTVHLYGCCRQHGDIP